DVVDVGVLGQSEFGTRARVQADGTIKLPFLGVLKVTGDTALTLADKVSAQLKAGGYYAKPIVTVDIALFASNYIVVLGEVGTPGLQPVDRTYHLSEVIARAGGIREGGADYVVLTRRDGTPRNLPFDKLARGTEADDPVVQAGDKVFVPASELFYIYGSVNQPGVYGLRAGMTLRMALGRAGGIGANGSDKRIKVYHDGTERKVGLDQPVQPGDVIVIGERLF
ncbi:MAG: SLBB domain-containing protein, partial [Sphingomonadaceae bacterium]|nr:SLBB domain-containing protein [Sphingomonadaceae bacterium]